MKKPNWFLWYILLQLAPLINNAQINAGNLSLPQKMIRLCNFSYITDTTAEKSIVKDSVQKYLGMKVVWGPVELVSDFGISYSAMFVAFEPATAAYTVVIRGTNFHSLKSWIGEDFQVRKAVKFQKFVKTAPAHAKISKGTCNGMEDLIKLKDGKQNLLGFLKGIDSMKALYVTGHSLGGTLTPPFYAYLCYNLFGGKAPATIASSPFSFAGLTAGDSSFNSYLQTYLQPGATKWRFVNPLDVAPTLWGDGKSLESMYTPYRLTYGFPENDLIGYLLRRAKPNNYRQPPGSAYGLPDIFNKTYNTWISQAEYQHHATTYMSLVDICCTKK